MPALSLELKKSSQFPKNIKKGVKNALARQKLDDDQVKFLTKIVSDAHVELGLANIKAMAGYKYLSY